MNIGDVFLTVRANLSQFQADLAGLNSAVSRSATDMGKTFTNVGRSLSGTGMAMTRNLTLPLVAAGGAASKFALDFDTTMRQIVALTDVTAEEVDGLKEGILALGGEVGKTPQELAEAFYFVASAGFEADEAFEVLEMSARASAAGMGEVQDVAKVLGSVINAYGKENLSAADAADMLTAAVGKGSAEAADFAGVLGRVSPAAANMGVSFDEVTAALAAMTNTGLSAEEAAVGLNQVFMSLLKTGPGADAALAEVGLSAEGLRRQLREEGLLSTLRTLEERFAGNETAAAKVFGNVRALRTVTSLLGLDTEQLNGIFAATADSAGALGQAYEDTEGPGRELARSMARLQAAAISVGEDVLPLVVSVLEEVAKAAEGLAEWWRSLDEDTQKLIVQILAFTAVAGPALVIIGKISLGLGALLKVVGFLTGAKGVPALVKHLGPAGLVGVLLAVAYAGSKASEAFGEFVQDVIHGKSAATTIRSMRDQIVELGDAAGPIAARLNELGVTSEEMAQAMEAAGGDVELAVRSLIDNNGDLAESLNDIANEVGEAAPAMSREWAEAWRGMAVTTEEGGRLVTQAAEQTPEDVAAAIRAGELPVGAAAEVMMDPLVDEAIEARQAAVEQMKSMIDGIAGMFESDESLQQAFQALLDRMDDPYTEAERRADIFSQNTIDLIRGALKSGDPKIAADTALLVENMLGEIELMQPGALLNGEAVPQKLREGMNRKVGALIDWIEKNITGESITALTLDEANELGFGNLWRYANGMERAQRDKVAKRLNAIQSDLRTKLSISLWQEGYNTASSYADGISAAEWKVFDASMGIGNTLRGGLAVYSEPKASWSPLRGITKWGGNLVQTIADGIAAEAGVLPGAIRSAFAGDLFPTMQPAFGTAGVGSIAPPVTSFGERRERTGIRDIHVHLEDKLPPVRRPGDIAARLRDMEYLGLLSEGRR